MPCILNVFYIQIKPLSIQLTRFITQLCISIIYLDKRSSLMSVLSHEANPQNTCKYIALGSSIPLSKISLLFVYYHSNLLVQIVLQQLKVFAVLMVIKIKRGTQTSNANESLSYHMIRFYNHLCQRG